MQRTSFVLVALAALTLAGSAFAQNAPAGKVYPPDHPPCVQGQDPGLCGGAKAGPMIHPPANDIVVLEPILITAQDEGVTVMVSAKNIVMVTLKEGVDEKWELENPIGEVLGEPVIHRVRAFAPKPHAEVDFTATMDTIGVGESTLHFVCKDKAGNVVRRFTVTVKLPLTPDVME